MSRNSAVDAEGYGLRFGRQIRSSDRAFHSLDPDLRTIDDFRHESSRSAWFVSKLCRNALAIHPFIFKAPFQRYVLRNIAFLIIASLIPERTFHDKLNSRTDERLQGIFLCERDLGAATLGRRPSACRSAY